MDGTVHGMEDGMAGVDLGAGTLGAGVDLGAGDGTPGVGMPGTGILDSAGELGMILGYMDGVGTIGDGITTGSEIITTVVEEVMLLTEREEEVS